MIVSINKIKNFGLFKDFKWSSDIPSFNQFNLIYGWNYSGKTTLSRIFRCIELKVIHSDFQNAEFELTDDQNNKITHQQMGELPYQFRVFNTDFVEENIHWDSQEANPIFILGKEDIALQKQIDLINQEIVNLNDENTNIIDNEISNLNKELENKLTIKARELDRIKPPYDKRKLRSALEKIKSDPEKFCLNEEDVQKLLEASKASHKNKVSEISIKTLPQNKITEIKEILDRTAVSQAIERLKNNPEVNEWVRKGLVLHKGKDKCEFCGSPLPENLLEEYEKHFSEEYENLMRKLNMLIEDLGKYKIPTSLPDEKRFYPQLESKYKDIKDNFEHAINGYNNSIDRLMELLREKIRNPFNKLADRLIHPDDIHVNEALKELNEVIREHNDVSDNFRIEQEKAFEKLELHYACEFNKENNYFDALNRLKELKDKKSQNTIDIEEKKRRITEIEAQLSDIAKAADKINQYLRSMFGREHIRIEAADKNRFKILRDGSDAKNLSSGEKTAIAFSYFLTRLEDKDTDISRAIIFIDDPISSLDSNHLYNTFALIQAKLSDCHQLIVSTHNHEFFNLIKEWFKDKELKGKFSFYLNERITKSGDEISDIRALPKTLFEYKSEYHFLFSKIKSFADNPSTDYESLYQLPNIIRRFLEAFIGFKYSAGLKNGLHQLIGNESDRIKVERFVHEFSHQRDLNRSVRFCDASECKSIVDIVLKSVESKDSEHYKTLENVYHNASR